MTRQLFTLISKISVSNTSLNLKVNLQIYAYRLLKKMIPVYEIRLEGQPPVVKKGNIEPIKVDVIERAPDKLVCWFLKNKSFAVTFSPLSYSFVNYLPDTLNTGDKAHTLISKAHTLIWSRAYYHMYLEIYQNIYLLFVLARSNFVCLIRQLYVKNHNLLFQSLVLEDYLYLFQMSFLLDFPFLLPLYYLLFMVSYHLFHGCSLRLSLLHLVICFLNMQYDGGWYCSI